MNIEEQLKQSNERLKNLLSHTAILGKDEIKQSQEEIDDIDESIEKYQTEVEELRQRLSNEENYKREKSDFELNERPVVEELLSDSIAQERDDVFESNKLYRKQQEQQTRMLGIYNSETERLKEDIKNIEARLNKDTLAKKRGIAKKLHLPEDEVAELKQELNYKKELIEEGNQVMTICADEIKRYGVLITTNNNRLKAITEKEQRLSSIMNNREDNFQMEIDKYKIRLDRDELAKKEAALEALKKRKDYLQFDPTEEIKKQIEQNEMFLKSLGKGEEVSEPEKEELVNNKEIVEGQLPLTQEQEEKESNKEAEGEKLPEVVEGEVEETNNEVEPEKEEVPGKAIIKIDDTPKDLVAIYDATEPLKEQKLSDRVKEAWNKWRKRVIAAAVATVLTVTSGIGIAKLTHNDEKEKLPETTKITSNDLFLNNNEDKLPEFTVEDKPKQDTDEFTQKDDNQIEENIKPVVEQTIVQAETPAVEQTEVQAETPVAEQSTAPVETPVISEDVEAKEENPVSEPIPEVESEQETQEDNKESVPEVDTTILKYEGEFAEIPLNNGDTAYIKYGDTNENIPEGISVKYDGGNMYIYSPVINAKSR